MYSPRHASGHFTEAAAAAAHSVDYYEHAMSADGYDGFSGMTMGAGRLMYARYYYYKQRDDIDAISRGFISRATPQLTSLARHGHRALNSP